MCSGGTLNKIYSKIQIQIQSPCSGGGGPILPMKQDRIIFDQISLQKPLQNLSNFWNLQSFSPLFILFYMYVLLFIFPQTMLGLSLGHSLDEKSSTT